jgi:hypothetical protein
MKLLQAAAIIVVLFSSCKKKIEIREVEKGLAGPKANGFPEQKNLSKSRERWKIYILTAASILYRAEKSKREFRNNGFGCRFADKHRYADSDIPYIFGLCFFG